MNYDEVFQATLRARHNLLTDDEIEAAERPRHGRLMRDDSECCAMVDAFKLHRAHTDAFRRAIDERDFAPAQGQTVCVVDLGSGAGNVGAAFIEAWADRALGLTYLGVEPHSLMRRLGIEFLRAFAPSWFLPSFVESVGDLAIPQADHYVVTLNYVLQQPGITGQDLKDWTSLLGKLRTMGRTCVVAVSPHSVSPSLRELDRSEEFRREMSNAGIVFDLQTTMHRMDRRMPREHGHGWVVQPARGADWPNIRIDRYELSPGAGRAPLPTPNGAPTTQA